MRGGGGVPDGQAFGDVDAQVVGARQRRDELQREGTEAADDAVGAADEDVLLAHHQTVGTRRLGRKIQKKKQTKTTMKIRACKPRAAVAVVGENGRRAALIGRRGSAGQSERAERLETKKTQNRSHKSKRRERSKGQRSKKEK